MKKSYQENVVEHVSKSFDTTMIGALDAFEKEFSEEMKDKDFKERFKEARKRVLDLGNSNKRNVVKVLNQSTLVKSSYKYNFEFKG